MKRLAVSPVNDALAHHRPHRGRDRPCEGRAARPDLDEDELAGRWRRSSTRSTGRARPASRSISSCAASAASGRGCRACPTTSASSRSSAASSSTAGSSASATATACLRTRRSSIIGSADMMPRNLDRRVEALVPITNPTVHSQVLSQIMLGNILDNQQSWSVAADGTSRRIVPSPGRTALQRPALLHDQPELVGPWKSAEDRMPPDLSPGKRPSTAALTEEIAARAACRDRRPSRVIDIGSNSVRLVIYEGLARSLTVLFNEKVLCGLGKGLAQTNRLDGQAVESALAALRRFRPCWHVRRESTDLYPIATAAAREAQNGPDFIAAAEAVARLQDPHPVRRRRGALCRRTASSAGLPRSPTALPATSAAAAWN